MVQLVRGIKAGIVAGLIYGIFYALWMWVLYYFLAPLLTGRYVSLAVNPFAFLIVGPVIGVILGAIYAFTYNRLPGKKLWAWTPSQTKGAVLAFIVWVILLVIAIPMGLTTSLLFSELEEYRVLQILVIVIALWLFVGILGSQIGRFWDRFERHKPESQRTEKPNVVA